MDVLAALQELFGWVYFFTWSATFYPQIILIFKRGTTAGLSTDFMIINIAGFTSYSIFTFSSYVNPDVAKAYEEHTGYPPQVDTSDILFAVHGAIMCAVLVAQLFYYPPRTPPRRPVLYVTSAIMAVVAIGLFACIAGDFDWYVYLSYAGFVKVLSSLVKHFPQLLLNIQRKSTVGWSYTMILLDVVGGGFSIAQQVVRSIRMQSAAPFTSNLAKTFLALESIVFDCLFIAQHVFWYTDRHDIDRDGARSEDPNAPSKPSPVLSEAPFEAAPLV